MLVVYALADMLEIQILRVLNILILLYPAYKILQRLGNTTQAKCSHANHHVSYFDEASEEHGYYMRRKQCCAFTYSSIATV